MFICLKGRLPKAWRIRETQRPLSSQSEVGTVPEMNRTSQGHFGVRATISHRMWHLKSNIIQSQAIRDNNRDGTILDTTLVKSTQAFRCLSRWLNSPDEDAAFWWHTTGHLLGLLLAEASYDLHSQYQALLYYNRCIVTSLGPRPDDIGTHKIWKSYMTDDHSPLEFSWNWSDSTKPPKIRCTVEAIPSDIDSIDPFNQAEVMKLARRLRGTLPNSDWQLFDHFALAFQPRVNSKSEAVVRAKSKSYRSSIFLGFEFEESEVGAKAYFAPVVETNDSQWQAIFRSVKALEHGQIRFPALLELDNFLAHSAEGDQLKVEGLAIDCVPLSKSRFKIYARSPLTSFDSMRMYMTMGGKLSHPEKVWRQLRDLWCLLLGLDVASLTTEDLLFNNHLTAGMMYNYDVQAGNAFPAPKLYINTKHYGRNDLDIAQGLTAFMEKYGRVDFTSNYRRAVDGFCSYRNLDQECGLQTYISCAVQNGSLSLTSYLSPQVYHRLGFYL